MSTIVFVEGLWHTGKSYFLNKLKEIVTEDDQLVIHDVPRRFLTVRHAMYLYYPLIFSQNQVFDRSPITTKAISDATLDIYSSDRLSPKYWNEFYQEWLIALKESQHKIVVLYFRPFNSGEVQAFSSIEKYVQSYPKDYLLVDPKKCTAKKLTALHDVYSKILLELKKEFKKKFQYYQVEFRDTADALDALRYEKILKENKPLIAMPEEENS